jgi:hypothetical protein
MRHDVRTPVPRKNFVLQSAIRNWVAARISRFPPASEDESRRRSWRLRSRMNSHIFTAMRTFAKVLDWADELGVEEQESLVEVLQRRLAERRRDTLVEAVKSARREFEGGGCRAATAKQIVKRILA